MEKYKVKVEDLSEKVYRSIKEMILKNELVPGQKLLQTELADKLGVSRTPLLFALSKLDKEMLIDSIPNRGYFVKKLSVQEELDLYDIRIRLEPLAALRAAENASKDQIRQLKRIIDKYENGSGYSRFCEYDYDFHSMIMQLGGNAMLERILSSFSIIILSNQMDLIKDEKPSLEDHRALVAAIENGDAEEAEKLMLRHIKNGKAAVEKYRK